MSPKQIYNLEDNLRRAKFEIYKYGTKDEEK